MNQQQLELLVANLDCEHDATRLRRGIDGRPGILETVVFPKSAKVRVTIDPAATSADLVRAQFERLGFPVRQRREGVRPPALWRNPKVLTSVASGVILAAGWLVTRAHGPMAVSWALLLLSLVVGAYYFGREAVEELVRERQVGIELLMLTAAVVATLMGQPLEGAMLAFLYSISEAMEGYTEQKTRKAIEALMDLAPKTATIRREGMDVEIPVEELGVSDIFLVRPGQAVPTDGTVVSGDSSLNQAPVTGESIPVEKHPGDAVFAGSLNGEGSLEVKATATFANNTIARIVQMVEEAQERKGKSQQFIERFGRRYSPLVLLAGAMVAVLPPALLGADWMAWLGRATVLVVAAAPCALVISIPITLVATLGTAARRGVLVKGGVYVEGLAGIEIVALDKTGTLTRGQPEVTDVKTLGDISESEALAAAAALERHSQHPLARAIVRHAEQRAIPTGDVEGFRSLTGAGATGRYLGHELRVGSVSLFEGLHQQPGAALADDIRQLQNQGKTIVVVGEESAPWAVIAIRDEPRPNARAAVEALRRAGVKKVVMLTGDNEGTARAIADQAGVDEVFANLTPEGKVEKVRELTTRHGRVAMVGDGVNDAPALAEASIGIAMGAAGTDVALETADVALMADDLERVAYAITLAKRNRSVVRQNLVLSALVMVPLIAGALSGLLGLPVAVLAHELSEFAVIGSGLRMLRA